MRAMVWRSVGEMEACINHPIEVMEKAFKRFEVEKERLVTKEEERVQEILAIATVKPPASLRSSRRSGPRSARAPWRKCIGVLEKRADKGPEVVLPVELTDITSKAWTVRKALDLNLEPIPNHHL